jgi:hypothetical protein
MKRDEQLMHRVFEHYITRSTSSNAISSSSSSNSNSSSSSSNNNTAGIGSSLAKQVLINYSSKHAKSFFNACCSHLTLAQHQLPVLQLLNDVVASQVCL